MTPDPLLRPLETLLNRSIAESSRARALLAQVAGKSLNIRVDRDALPGSHPGHR